MREEVTERNAWQQAYLRTLCEEPDAHFVPMQEAMRRLGVKIPTLPQPLLLPFGIRSALQAQVEALAEAFDRAVQDILRGRLAAWMISMRPEAWEVARLDAEREQAMFCARFDGFWDDKAGVFRVMECNAGDPSGAGFTDAFLAAMRLLPAMQKLRCMGDIHEDILLDAYAGLVNATLAPPAAWVQLSDAASLVHDEHRLIVEGLKARGLSITLADPRSLRWDGKRLWSEERPIDGVIRDTIDELLLEGYWPATRPLFDAYRAGAVKLINPFCTIVADYKGLLEPLSSPHYQESLPQEVRAVLRECMPWTFVVREEKVLYEDREVDLLSLLREQRSEWVLKPNEGYGGFGVILGRVCSADIWEQTLQEAVMRPFSYVAQRAWPASRGRFVMQDAQGRAQVVEKNVTLSAWVHKSRFVGCFARISDSSVINVHQGGALLPVVFVSSST
ncbi:circularly permuted type 2 ATP-grasp protein [Myxococcota bacterium]|nr:circularly permuted type 2 ATP-grasp protein [Myxococcota bacterium]